MSAVAAKIQVGTRKFQLGTAVLAVAAAATLTPSLAQATPNLAPFMAGIGDSITQPILPSIVTGAAVTTDPCTAANFKLGCYMVEGVVAGTRAIVRGVVVIVGTVAYVLVAGIGQLLKLVGEILPGPLGDFFTNVGDGVSAFANSIAQTLHVGPYLTSQ